MFAPGVLELFEIVWRISNITSNLTIVPQANQRLDEREGLVLLDGLVDRHCQGRLNYFLSIWEQHALGGT